MFSRTRLDKLAIKIDCSSISKEGQIQAVHNLLNTELQHNKNRSLEISSAVRHTG